MRIRMQLPMRIRMKTLPWGGGNLTTQNQSKQGSLTGNISNIRGNTLGRLRAEVPLQEVLRTLNGGDQTTKNAMNSRS
ncbi:hypothetical protein PoB_003207300 [Plakobranchus ocellatus]|uniref:Uncharacterized protein n=1 Tax=Plakobranchus ocellatus TaxID=259542 RepID=A0AAV4AFM0_9GAST|nr:hypothetical protein PoB_003207300 [Plakobranchus ocellatus]